MIDLRFAKPLDEELIRKTLAGRRVCVTIEEGAIGGLGAHVLTLASDAGADRRGAEAAHDAAADLFQDEDSPQAQYDAAGLNRRQIVDCVLKTAPQQCGGQEAGARA